MLRRNDIRKIMIIGFGAILIGQAGEFDCSGTHAYTPLPERHCYS
jgi:carbamoylphosphate synthase large subunit